MKSEYCSKFNILQSCSKTKHILEGVIAFYIRQGIDSLCFQHFFFVQSSQRMIDPAETTQF